jgi:hypothetical protein
MSEYKGFFFALFAPALRSLRLKKDFTAKNRKVLRKVRKDISCFQILIRI